MEGAEQTLVVWHRLGKEHGEGQGFRRNSAQTVDRHLREKADRFRLVPETEWRWWQIDDNLIVEKPLSQKGLSERSVIYYMTNRGWALIEDFSPRKDDRWFWYIHIAAFAYNAGLQSWVMTDMFADVVVGKDGKDHTVLDLDELANAARIGLISQEELLVALDSTQDILDLIRDDRFPPGELERCHRFLKSRDWR